jgi:phospholipase/carboxylesterase
MRPHVWHPGADGAPPLLLLHGTGGDEHEILWLHDALSPQSPVLSVRGSVVEDGMNRHFRRFAEGVLDEIDLERRVDELAAFLARSEVVYGVKPGSWVAVGFSNGANLASATLLRRPDVIRDAVLFAAMPPFRGKPFVDLSGQRVVVSNGRQDPLVTAEQTATLVGQLRAAGATVTEQPHDGGHEIGRSLLPGIGRSLALDVALEGDGA